MSKGNIESEKQKKFKKEYGRKLKQARIDSGKTQQELAQMVGVSASCIGMYERGVRSPDFETELKLADVLEVHFSELRSIPTPAIMFDNLEDLQGLRAVIEGYRELSADGKRELSSYLNYLLSKEGGADGN